MNTTESKKKYDDSEVTSYLENHNVYESSDIGIDIAAVVQYARTHGISLSSVPQDLIDRYATKPEQLVG